MHLSDHSVKLFLTILIKGYIVYAAVVIFK